MKIKIGICGYGNLGKGVESEISKNSDMELIAVFTRRNPVESLKISSNVPVVHVNSIAEWKNKIDVMILCGGSANDLPEQGPEIAKHFNTIDSFDNHKKILQYFKAVDNAAKLGNNISIVSIGWDPGLFSLMRMYMGAVIPTGKTYTFWGKGVSQGHSQAIRRIIGVVDAVQYTIPIDSAMEKVRNGENPNLSVREKHTRLCYVVAAEKADRSRIENEIKEMPNYFDEYDTTVIFISAEELKANHSSLPHGGNVIHIGATGSGNKQVIEFSLKLNSNPEFTSSVLLSFARAAFRLSQNGDCGAKTILDIPPALLSPHSIENLMEKLL
ncbi:MAG: diaminopimelate dehydrogenase [Clostridiales bacterium]|jgi:diaminopimelate dehydrogenase|nr:diaminopimelate dehydrogenase [Clostridiales bacterium]